ncbi:MAG: hypothetical protein J6Z11_10675 [Candidatus Riflebacteria bacterium]|nr:hypothetical protein [Candidatus Riflebacteria bacterium]
MDLDLIILIIKLLFGLLVPICIFLFVHFKVKRISKEAHKNLDDINKMIDKTNKKLGIKIDTENISKD